MSNIHNEFKMDEYKAQESSDLERNKKAGVVPIILFIVGLILVSLRSISAFRTGLVEGSEMLTYTLLNGVFLSGIITFITGRVLKRISFNSIFFITFFSIAMLNLVISVIPTLDNIGATALSEESKPAIENQVIMLKDNKMQIEVPGDWKKDMSTDYNDAELAMFDEKGELGIVIYGILNESNTNLDDIFNANLEEFKKEPTYSNIGNKTEYSIGKYGAISFEFIDKSNGQTPTEYIMTFVKTDDKIYIISAVASETIFTECKNTLYKVTKSFVPAME